MHRLAFRAFVYVAFSSVVWTLILLAPADPPLETVSLRFLWTSAFVCVLGSVLTFVGSAFCRRRGLNGFVEYAASLVGRTGVPCAVALTCTVMFPAPSVARAVVYRLLVAYFLTAPAHVLLSIPPRIYFESDGLVPTGESVD